MHVLLFVSLREDSFELGGLTKNVLIIYLQKILSTLISLRADADLVGCRPKWGRMTVISVCIQSVTEFKYFCVFIDKI